MCEAVRGIEYDNIPEYGQLKKAISTLALTVGFSDEQIAILEASIAFNQEQYKNLQNDLRKFDTTESGSLAPKPMHHLMMVYLFLKLCTDGNLGASDQMQKLFPSSVEDKLLHTDAIFLNTLVLLFHDFIDDSKGLSDRNETSTSQSVREIINYNATHLATTLRSNNPITVTLWAESKSYLSIRTRLEEIGKDMSTIQSGATHTGLDKQKISLCVLYDFLKKQFITNKLRRQGLEMPENLAHFVMRKVWLMTHIYANPKQKTHKKITFARHGVDPILVLNKILDYITNGLSASSLTVGEDKKLEGVRQLDERGDFAWMLPILPALLRELKQYVQIDDGYIQEVKTVVGELAQKQSTTPYTTLLTHLLSLDPQ